MRTYWSRRELYAHGEPFGCEDATRKKIGGGYICGGGGKGSAPPAPDYTAAAEAQADSSKEVTNMQTYANRPTQNTPFGSVTWDTSATTDPATGQQVTQWTQNYNLTPEAQQALNSQLAVQQGRSDLAESFMGRVEDAYSKPFNWDAVPQAGSLVNTPGFDRLGPAPELQKSVSQGNSLERRQGINPVQDRVNLNDNAALQGGTGADRMRIEDQLFDRMRPEHQRQQSGLETRLANMGLTMGSEAYNREMQRLGDQQSRERFNALEMGGAEMQRQADIQRQNRALQTSEDFQGAGLFNMANNQSFQQDMARLGLNNQAELSEFARRLQAGTFANQANMSQFGMEKDRLGFNNQASQQEYQNAFEQSRYANQLRQQAIAEQAQERGMSLNEMNALLTGQQVGMTPMPQFNAAAASQATQYLPAAQAQYQAGLDAFNAQNMSSNSFTSGLFGLGGSLGSAAMFSFSDKRLKKIIKRVGEIKGVPLYLFKYLGSDVEHTGVIAQELQKKFPDMVRRHQNGYLMVNYSALEA